MSTPLMMMSGRVGQRAAMNTLLLMVSGHVGQCARHVGWCMGCGSHQAQHHPVSAAEFVSSTQSLLSLVDDH